MSISRDLFQATPITLKPFPRLHKRINPYHLHTNQKLLTEEEIATLPEKFANTNRIKFESCNKERYTILKLKNLKEETSYYAVYYGVKHDTELGQGNFGKVKLLQHLESGKWLALKIIKKSDANKVTVKNEVDVLIKLGLLERIDQREDQGVKKQIFIATELIEGMTLKDFLESHPYLSWQKRLKIAGNTIRAYSDFTKTYHLLHCDIKPENIMINPIDYKISLIDYQFAEDAPSTSGNLKFHFTVAYAAPEILDVAQDKDVKNRQFTYNEQTEVFSLGITLAHILNIVKAMDKEITYYAPHAKNRFLAMEQHYDGDYDVVMTLDEVIERGDFTHETMEHLIDTLGLLHKMTAVDANTRPKVEVVQTLFDKALQQYESDPFSQRTVGLLDINDYDNLKYNMQDRIHSALQQTDVVWLIDSKSLTDNDLLYKRGYLDRYRVLAEENVILTNGNSISNTLLQLADKVRDQHLVFVSTETVSKELTQSMQQKGIIIIEASLVKKDCDYHNEIMEQINAKDLNNNTLIPKVS